MDWQERRRRLASSPFAAVAALPMRAGRVVRHDARVLRLSARWLLRSREHTNLTYHLTRLNREQLAWFVALVAGIPAQQARGYLDELEHDADLRRHVAAATRASARRGLADGTVRYGRRLGWYALVRALRPAHVVETGTDKGLGSCVLAAALLRNGTGRLTTIDTNPDAGYLLLPPYRDVTDLRLGSSVEILPGLTPQVDLFLHDSDHSPGYERAELAAVERRLRPDALVLSDNADRTAELSTWAERRGRRFAYFAERPAEHWFAGGGIGAALPGGRGVG